MLMASDVTTDSVNVSLDHAVDVIGSTLTMLVPISCDAPPEGQLAGQA
jgi:hypothetical protein